MSSSVRFHLNERHLWSQSAVDAFAGRAVRIWSQEHRLWWRENRAGYTSDPQQAGLYDLLDAYLATRGCGPEKRIVYELVGGWDD